MDNFKVEDKVFAFYNGCLFEGVISIKTDNECYEIKTEHDGYLIVFERSLYLKGRDEKKLLKDIDFEIEYLNMKKRHIINKL